ncbi:NlpC/P60 family protein [Streptomyces sp. NPDC056987]|uniref:C40 family peptidase n=1 Tax=Streptomyces sp. NPDC056987 TaxID=3345988 RepID=UPI00362FE486
MASHRKARSRSGVRTNTPAVGITTAALASVTLLSTQSADAAPTESKSSPSVEEVEKKVSDLYRQAGGDAQRSARTKEATAKQKRTVDRVIDGVAKSADKLNEARRTLGSYTSAQSGGGAGTPAGAPVAPAASVTPAAPAPPVAPVAPVTPVVPAMPATAPAMPATAPAMPATAPAAVLFADSPQTYVEQTGMTERLTDRQQSPVADHWSSRADTRAPESPDESQESLRTSKEQIQKKLAEARALLARLTAEEQARLAALERKKEEAARRTAEAQAKAEARDKAEADAEAERRREAELILPRSQPQAPSADPGTGTGSGTGTGTDAATVAGANAGTAGGTGLEAVTGGDPAGIYAAKAAKVLAFARTQIGKPYVWGASGPSSYDSSGLTQAAWRAAGVELPRSTSDQVDTGTRVTTDDLLPGDLVFFYDDISHAGIYIGDGMMIHAPKPGANVREESIYYLPIYGSVRPA